MPTYEYACKDCGEHLEVVQSFRDEALTNCPSCQGALRKVFSAAGIIFKGSGWHVKDYASSGSRPAAVANSGDGESGGESGAQERATTDTSGASAKESSGSGDTAATASKSESSSSSNKAATSTATAKKSA